MTQPPILTARPRWKKAIGIAFVAMLFTSGGAPRHLARDDTRLLAATRAPVSATLAVLPLRNIQGEASQDYFADVMTEALITSLTRSGKLRVTSLASPGRLPHEAEARKAIQENPSITRVLTGTVVQFRGRVRIDVRLIDPRTQAIVWSNHYEREMQDLLAMESDLAEAIAGEVQVSLSAQDRERMRPRTVKPEALDAYRRGRYFWNRRTENGLQRAVQSFHAAIAAAPDYAPAYSGLADAYSLLGSVGTDGMAPNQAMPLARAAAEKALALDPDLADAHVSLAYIKLSYDWDLRGASEEFTQAMVLNPNSATGRHWLSHYFLAAGDVRQASEQMRAALDLEPLSPSINVGVGWCLYYSKNYDAAIERFRAVTESDPSLPLAHQTLGMAYHQKGLLDRALEEYRRAAELSGNGPAAVAGMASVYAAMGRHADAARELARLEEMARTRYVSALYFASVHQAMGNLPKMFTWGWKAIGEKCDYLMYLRLEPRVGKLAGNPEFLRAISAMHR